MKRKYLIVALTLLLGAVYVQAQGGGQGGQRPDPKVQAKNQTDTWQEALGLSDVQHKKVYDILIKASEERTKKMQELRASGSREDMQKAMTDSATKLDSELKKVFTETQWPMYEKWKIDNPPQQRGRRGGN